MRIRGNHEDLSLLLEQMTDTIAEAQAALLAGRLRDLETFVRNQQDLCHAFKGLQGLVSSERGLSAQDHDTQAGSLSYTYTGDGSHSGLAVNQET